MRIENINEDNLEDIDYEIYNMNIIINFTPEESEKEKLRWRMIARLSDICLKNWFGKEHSPDYKGFCKYCGARC